MNRMLQDNSQDIVSPTSVIDVEVETSSLRKLINISNAYHSAGTPLGAAVAVFHGLLQAFGFEEREEDDFARRITVNYGSGNASETPIVGEAAIEAEEQDDDPEDQRVIIPQLPVARQLETEFEEVVSYASHVGQSALTIRGELLPAVLYANENRLAQFATVQVSAPQRFYILSDNGTWMALNFRMIAINIASAQEANSQAFFTFVFWNDFSQQALTNNNQHLLNYVGEDIMTFTLKNFGEAARRASTIFSGKNAPNANGHAPIKTMEANEEDENISTGEFLLAMAMSPGEVSRCVVSINTASFPIEAGDFDAKKKNIFFMMLDQQLKTLGIDISEDKIDHSSLSAYLAYRCGIVENLDDARLAVAVLNAAFIFLQVHSELELVILYQIKEAFYFAQYDDELKEKIGFDDAESDNDRESMASSRISKQISFKKPSGVTREESMQYGNSLLAAFHGGSVPQESADDNDDEVSEISPEERAALLEELEKIDRRSILQSSVHQALQKRVTFIEKANVILASVEATQEQVVYALVILLKYRHEASEQEKINVNAVADRFPLLKSACTLLQNLSEFQESFFDLTEESDVVVKSVFGKRIEMGLDDEAILIIQAITRGWDKLIKKEYGIRSDQAKAAVFIKNIQVQILNMPDGVVALNANSSAFEEKLIVPTLPTTTILDSDLALAPSPSRVEAEGPDSQRLIGESRLPWKKFSPLVTSESNNNLSPGGGSAHQEDVIILSPSAIDKNRQSEQEAERLEEERNASRENHDATENFDDSQGYSASFTSSQRPNTRQLNSLIEVFNAASLEPTTAILYSDLAQSPLPPLAEVTMDSATEDYTAYGPASSPVNVPIAAPYVYPIPKDGDCLYSGFLVAMIHGFFTEAVNEEDEAATFNFIRARMLLGCVAAKLNYVFEAETIIGQFQELMNGFQDDEYRLFNTYMVPVLREMIATHELAVNQEDENDLINSAFRMTSENDRIIFSTQPEKDRPQPKTWEKHIDSVHNEKHKHGNPAGSIVEFVALEQMFNVTIDNSELNRILPERTSHRQALNIENTGYHYVVNVNNKNEDLAVFCDAANATYEEIDAKTNRRSKEEAERLEEEQKAQEERRALEERLTQQRLARAEAIENERRLAAAQLARNASNSSSTTSSSSLQPPPPPPLFTPPPQSTAREGTETGQSSGYSASSSSPDINPSRNLTSHMDAAAGVTKTSSAQKQSKIQTTPSVVEISSDTAEKFKQAIGDYYRYKDDAKKHKALDVLINIVFNLSDNSLGLTVCAPSAKAALEKLLINKTTSMNAVYLHLYTILQAIFVAEKKRGSSAHAKEALAKELLQWLSVASQQSIPHLKDLHPNMIGLLCGCTPAEKVLAQLDKSDRTYSSHDRTLKALEKLSFVWSKFYKNDADEEDARILEQRRHFEVISVSVLKDIIKNCNGGVALTLEEHWLLVTAITDYDEAIDYLKLNPKDKVRATSPFYNAIQLLALEQQQESQTLRDQLCASFVVNYVAVEASDLEQKNLQRKMEARAHLLFAKESSASNIQNNSTVTPASAQHTPDSATLETSSVASSGSVSTATSLNAAWKKRVDKYSGIVRALKKEEIIEIFEIFDFACHVTEKNERDGMMPLLTRAFNDMKKLFDEKVSRGGYGRNTSGFWSSKDGVAPLYFDDLMKHIAPKSRLPAYTFAQFCAFQANTGSKLYKYEYEFIRKHIDRLYTQTDSDELKTMKYNREDLRDYVAPISQDVANTTKHSAMSLIYPRLDAELKQLERRMNYLEEKDVKPYLNLELTGPSEKDENGKMINRRVLKLREAVEENALRLQATRK